MVIHRNIRERHAMKANEMNVWDLGKGRGEWEWSRVNPDGKWVTYSDAMQVIQALEAKIKGMIERPKIRVVSIDDERQLVWLTDDDKFPNTASVKVDYEGYECLVKWFGFPTIDSLTKALGMEGDK